SVTASCARATPSLRPAHRSRRSSGSRTARPSSGDHLLEDAVLMDLAENRARLEQLRLRALRRDVTVVDDHDLVGERDRTETVGDDDRGPAAHHLTQARPDVRLRCRVDGCGRVVEDEDPRIDEERPRDRDALTLTAREG